MEDKDLNKLSNVISAFKKAEGTKVAVYDRSLSGYYSDWGEVKGLWIDTTAEDHIGFIVKFPTKGIGTNTIGIDRIYTYSQLDAQRQSVSETIDALTYLKVLTDTRDKMLAQLHNIEALLIKYEQMEASEQSE